VILRDDEGIVIESHVLRTLVKKKSSSQQRIKNKRLEKARTWASKPLPSNSP